MSAGKLGALNFAPAQGVLNLAPARLALLIPASLLLANVMFFSGCGGGSNNSATTNATNTSSATTRGITPPGTYQIAITVSSANATQSTTVTFVVR